MVGVRVRGRVRLVAVRLHARDERAARAHLHDDVQLAVDRVLEGLEDLVRVQVRVRVKVRLGLGLGLNPKQGCGLPPSRAEVAGEMLAQSDSTKLIAPRARSKMTCVGLGLG